jgi:HK97 gp10 family phage protein
MRVYVEVDGFNDVINKMAQMEDKGKSCLNEATEAGAKYLQPKVKTNIPVSNEDDKHLKDSIKISKSRSRKKGVGQTQVVVGKKSVDYGFHVEAGTRKMAGRSFMRHTADDEAEAVAEVVVEAFLKKLGV